MATECEVIYPFGERLYIGIIKFFDSTKGFGYIASNNHGMESKKRFRENELGFYIDNSSWESPVSEKKAVVFCPAIKNMKLRAEKVRPVNLDTDRALVMDYYEHNNFICYDEKVKRYSLGRYGRQHFEGYDNERRKYNILMKCGICRYELLNEYATYYAQNHNFDFLIEKIGKIIDVIGGEEAYNKQLRGRYGNKENEHASWKTICELLNEELIFKLYSIHPSLQIFVPDEILLKVIQSVDKKWGASEPVMKVINQLEEARKLKEIEGLIDSHLPNKTRKEIEDIRKIYGTQIDTDRIAIIDNCIDRLTLSQIKEILTGLSAEDTSRFLQKAKSFSDEYSHLSSAGRSLFRKENGYIYEKILSSQAEKFSKLNWFDNQRKEFKNFLINDNVVNSEHYSTPIKIFKKGVISDYESLFVQSEGNDSKFNRHREFDSEYSCLFNENEHESILLTIENKCLEIGGLFSTARLFIFLNKKLPEYLKKRFLLLSLEDIISNIYILKMFEDCGRSILSNIVDKMCENEDYIFHRRNQSSEYCYRINIGFAKALVSICGCEYVEQQFIRLKTEDRLDLFVELQLNVVTVEELRNYLLTTEDARYQTLLSNSIGKDAVISIIMGSDCSTKEGIKDATTWLNRYIGDEPDDYNDKVEWNKRKKAIIDIISHSSNEYLKVLTWALYFMSSGKISLLKDVFYLYPTPLQIRILKRFFNLMTKGKFPTSLQKLIETLGGDSHKLSLPVEIVLKYLSLKIENPEAQMTDAVMLSIIYGREDYNDWFMINQMLNPCKGRLFLTFDGRNGTGDAYRNFSGTIKKGTVKGNEVYRLELSRKQITLDEQLTQYNNKQYDCIKEHISITFLPEEYKEYKFGENMIYDFNLLRERDLRIMAEVYRLKMCDVHYNKRYEVNERDERFCCECRVSDNLDKDANKVFLWCRNRTCFHHASYYRTSYEWEDYTVLDFMRILAIPTDYVSQKGKTTRHGQYTIFSTYMLSFHEFFKHLKCRKCGKLMDPYNISNFARSSLTEYACKNADCELNGNVVYLNKCFNSKCNSIIDSRDSKKCPNGGYICKECGACCSDRKFSERYEHLQVTGGYVSQWLLDAIRYQIGHWEKNELYCSSCGKKMERNKCSCGKTYERRTL